MNENSTDSATSERIQEAISKSPHMGELKDADSVGTAGSPDCGDMLRMWMKFGKNDKGDKVVEKASFQSYGCETAMAIASVATQLLEGKTVDEARSMKSEQLSAPLGALPPMKIHCASLVEEAMKQALDSQVDTSPKNDVNLISEPHQKGTLAGSMQDASGKVGPKAKIVFKKK